MTWRLLFLPTRSTDAKHETGGNCQQWRHSKTEQPAKKTHFLLCHVIPDISKIKILYFNLLGIFDDTIMRGKNSQEIYLIYWQNINISTYYFYRLHYLTKYKLKILYYFYFYRLHYVGCNLKTVFPPVVFGKLWALEIDLCACVVTPYDLKINNILLREIGIQGFAFKESLVWYSYRNMEINHKYIKLSNYMAILTYIASPYTCPPLPWLLSRPQRAGWSLLAGPRELI